MAEIPNREVLDRLAAAEAENVVLREALRPFADVIDMMRGTQDLDRDVRLSPCVAVHWSGPGASGGCVLSAQTFFAAHKALASPARGSALAELVRRALEWGEDCFNPQSTLALKEAIEKYRSTPTKEGKDG